MRLAAALPLILLLGCDDADTEASTDVGDTSGPTASETAPESTSTSTSSDATTASPTTTTGTPPTTTTGPSTTGSADATDPTTGSDSDTQGSDESTGEDRGDQDPPMGGAELVPWLEAREYAKWHAESAVHDSAGPHFGDVRTFLNDAAFDSLSAGAATHTPSAALVKELYGDGPEVRGWAVMVKTVDGSGGDTWYWFEIYDGTTYSDSVGDGQCVGCHSDGQDHIRTPFPLQ